jgi:hypothetical protein
LRVCVLSGVRDSIRQAGGVGLLDQAEYLEPDECPRGLVSELRVRSAHLGALRTGQPKVISDRFRNLLCRHRPTVVEKLEDD